MQTAINAGAGVLLCLVISLPLLSVAHAGPNDAVNSPIVEEGEGEIGFQFGTSKARDGSRESALSVGLAYGLNAWWSIELTMAANRQTPEGWRFDAFEWENKFQLTETGKYPADVGGVLGFLKSSVPPIVLKVGNCTSAPCSRWSSRRAWWSI